MIDIDINGETFEFSEDQVRRLKQTGAIIELEEGYPQLNPEHLFTFAEVVILLDADA